MCVSTTGIGMGSSASFATALNPEQRIGCSDTLLYSPDSPQVYQFGIDHFHSLDLWFIRMFVEDL